MAGAGAPVGDADQGFEEGEAERAEAGGVAQGQGPFGPGRREGGGAQDPGGEVLAGGQPDGRGAVPVRDAEQQRGLVATRAHGEPDVAVVGGGEVGHERVVAVLPEQEGADELVPQVGARRTVGRQRVGAVPGLGEQAAGRVGAAGPQFLLEGVVALAEVVEAGRFDDGLPQVGGQRGQRGEQRLRLLRGLLEVLVEADPGGAAVRRPPGGGGLARYGAALSGVQPRSGR